MYVAAWHSYTFHVHIGVVSRYAPADARPTRCPRDRDGLAVTPAVGEVFDRDADDAWCDESGAEPTAWFDCDASIRCTEPQYVMTCTC